MRTIYAISALLLGACSTIASADAPAWALHGFGDISAKNDYVTPRGLVVTTSGWTTQVLGGLALVSPSGVAFTAGTWTDLNPGYNKKENTTALNEFDYFFGIDYDVVKNLNVGVQYVQFISGQPKFAFKTERNVEFSLKYKDGGKPLSLNPYAKLFWAVSSKSSTVVLGKAGDTFDIELGAVPTYAGKGYTISMPTWVTVGPKTYWGTGANKDGNVGVVSTGLKVGTPLTFIKSGGGASIYAAAQYYHLVNDNLVTAKAILNSGAHKRDQVVFGVGMGFGF